MKTQPKTETQPAATPEWVTETLAEHTYSLEMFESNDSSIQSIDMSRAEYIAIKQHLATMRGIATPRPPAEPAAAAEEHVDLAADFAEIEEANHGSDTPAESFITHLVMVSHFRPLTPDEAAECLETFRDEFDCMAIATRTFVARYPEAVKSAA